MRALAVFIVVIAGCSSTLDGPCSLTEPCDDDQVCDFTATAGPTCITASGDVDGDGLTNDKDFCHHAPGGAFDEDGDGAGDECDRCPIAPPRATPDSDGDMVDAPCDPEPTEAGEAIIFFDGFGAGLAAEWRATNASAWTGGTGEVSVNLSVLTEQEFLQHNLAGKANIAMEVGYRVDRVENTATRHLVGVSAVDTRPAGVARVQCGVSRFDGTADVVVVETNTGAMSQATMDPALNTAKSYRAGAYVMGTSAGCSAIADNMPIGAVQTSITPDVLSTIALTARAVSVRYQYVLVVGRD